MVDLAQGAPGDQRPGGLHLPGEALVHPQHEVPAARLRRGDHLPRLGDAQGEGLVKQYVLARLERRPGDRRVQAVGDGDVDRIDRIHRQEPLRVVEDVFDPVALREVPGPPGVAVGHRDEFRFRQPGKLPAGDIGYGAGADHAESRHCFRTAHPASPYRAPRIVSQAANLSRHTAIESPAAERPMGHRG